MAAAFERLLEVCRTRDLACGGTVTPANAALRMEQGYRIVNFGGGERRPDRGERGGAQRRHRGRGSTLRAPETNFTIRESGRGRCARRRLPPASAPWRRC